MNSFGDDLVVKMRKPYTITKQREKWTEEEHNRFLEALKLYGRAWQRIEEHIGTKTAIQIRSHAQKFFTKLEKEAVAAGSTSGQAHDIAIPPPRPKRKPNYPYPRKTVICSIPPASETADDKTLQAMNNPSPQAIINKQEASVAPKLLQETKECSDGGHSSLVLNLFQDAPSASLLSRDNNKGYKNRLVGFGEYVPMSAQPKEQPSLTGGSSLTIEVNLDSTLNGVMKSNQALGRTSGINIKLHASSDSDYEGPNAEIAMQPTCIDGSNKLKATVEIGGSPSNASALTNHANPVDPAFHDSSAMSCISPFPTFPSFAQLRTTQDLHRSFLGISPTFSTQIVSSLMQNPAVHAAACMAAASLYPAAEEMESPCTTAAIAAATIAAASAWWGTNGLIPVFPPPIHHASGFAFPPPAASSIPAVNTDQAAAQEKVEGMHATNFSNSDRAKMVKHERSSCGSNASSSSEMETDAAMLTKNGETNNKDIIKQSSNFQQNLPAGEANNTRRGRASSSLCLNESWKEVSQEGRLAFQALFTRDILPQSFATQFVKPAMGWPKEEGVPASGWEEAPTQNCSVSNEIKLGNLKVVRPTGFKPYKRCSAEVEVCANSANDESSKYKKIRVQGGVSS